MAFLRNSTFENGLGGWRAINGSNLVTLQIMRDGTARSGASFLRVLVGEQDGSVGSDFQLANQIRGDTNLPDQFELAATNSVAALAYVRAAPGAPTVSGQLKLWALGLENNAINNNGTNFNVGNDWTLINHK